MTEEAQCIFHKDKVIQKIKDIIGGLNNDKATVESAKTAAESANTELKKANDTLGQKNDTLEQANKEFQESNVALTNKNTELTNKNTELNALNLSLQAQISELEITNRNLSSTSGEAVKKLNNQLTKLRNDKEKLNEELTKNKTTQDEEINKLNNKLEKQEKTSNENMNKIISTLVSERNRLLEESEESKKNQEEALAKAVEALEEKEKQQTAALEKAQGEAKEALAKALAAKEELEKVQADAKTQAEAKLEAQLTKLEAELQAELQAKEAELQTALTKCNQEKEELKQATESMNNIEKIQNSTNLSRTDIQTKLWETAKTYMESQFNDENYQTTITSDPFVQVELKTLLNDDTEVTQDVTSEKIKDAHNKVIERHYKTIYPNANNLEVPTKVTDHIVIPPYLYLSLTHFYTIFSFLETRQFYMRFLDQGQDQKQDLNLEIGFHIIIKKLGDGDQDFFSRVDVKFVLLETQTKAKEVIDKIFKESTFYGHIPTQTILHPGYTGNITAGGNKTLKNNKRRLKKRRKYTQSNRRK